MTKSGKKCHFFWRFFCIFEIFVLILRAFCIEICKQIIA